jgi:hypothetical protein
MTPSCQESVSLGAYLLGALEPEERRAMELHIAGCGHCRAELVELAPLPGLLRHTPFEELEESAQAAESLTPVRQQPPAPAAAPQHRRRRRGRTLTAAGLALAACAAGAAVYTGLNLGSAAKPSVQAAQPAAATWTATDPTTHVSVSAAVQPEVWGSQFQLKLGGLPIGITCHLVVHGTGGRSETAGTWGSGYSQSASVPASSSISPSDITGMAIVSGTGGTLVQVAPGK